MTEETLTFNVTLMDEGPLKDSWDEYARQLVDNGASRDQIEMLKVTFYVGATQAFARISRSTETGKKFVAAMTALSAELDFIKKCGGFETEGNA